MEEILNALLKHYDECSDYYNKLHEEDKPMIEQDFAFSRLAGVEECVQITRRIIDDSKRNN